MMPSAGQQRGLGPRAASARAATWVVRTYLAAFAALAAVYFAVPGWRGGVWAAMGLAAVAALAGGVLRHRPAHRAPWLLLAAALAVFVCGAALDIARNSGSGGQTDWFPNTDWF